jgi:hypothetical protein
MLRPTAIYSLEQFHGTWTAASENIELIISRIFLVMYFCIQATNGTRWNVRKHSKGLLDCILGYLGGLFQAGYP